MKGRSGTSMQIGNGLGRGRSPRSAALNGPTKRKAFQILEAVRLGRATLDEFETSVVEKAASPEWTYTLTYKMRAAVFHIWKRLAAASALSGLGYSDSPHSNACQGLKDAVKIIGEVIPESHAFILVVVPKQADARTLRASDLPQPEVLAVLKKLTEAIEHELASGVASKVYYE